MLRGQNSRSTWRHVPQGDIVSFTFLLKRRGWIRQRMQNADDSSADSRNHSQTNERAYAFSLHVGRPVDKHQEHRLRPTYDSCSNCWGFCTNSFCNQTNQWISFDLAAVITHYKLRSLHLYLWWWRHQVRARRHRLENLNKDCTRSSLLKMERLDSLE